MRIRKPGKIKDGLWCLGREESCVYLIQSRDDVAILSGGMSYILPLVLQQLEANRFRMSDIKKLVILHSHFDHVGIVPYLWRFCTNLEIFASKRAEEILHSPKTIDTINEFNKNANQWAGRVNEIYNYDLEWRENICFSIVEEGDVIQVGDYNIEILETPGHSSCSITAYVDQLGAIFPSDAGGIPFEDVIITSGNSNYTLYQQSLEKLNYLPVNIYCADHYGYVTGSEATDFLLRSIDVAKKTRERMESVYLKTEDIDLAAKQLADSFRAEYPKYVLPPDINEAVQRQMLRHISKCME